MASYFNLILDTLAPSGLSLQINGGAQYTTAQSVTLAISVDDADTVGKESLEYECRIYDNSGHVYHVCMGMINVIKANIVTLSATDT
ncbi:MAG: hypothetical protein ACI4TD_07340 [Phocaeicola sp.]